MLMAENPSTGPMPLADDTWILLSAAIPPFSFSAFHLRKTSAG